MNRHDEIEALREQIASMQRRLDELETNTSAPKPEPDRRTAIKLAAGALAGAAASTLASRPAAADDPNDITLSQVKTTTGGVTDVRNTGTTHEMAFVFQSGTPFGAQTALFPAALGGWTQDADRPTGVFAFSNQEDGSGVVGWSQSEAGAVSSLFDFDGHGVAAYSDSDSAVYGRHAGGSLRSGVEGESEEFGAGVRGKSQNGIGVRGTSTGYGIGGEFAGRRAQLRFSQIGSSPTKPLGSTAEHTRGELLYSMAGDVQNELWCCVESGSPGTWRKLAGQSTAGAFHPVTPIRAYDSRIDTYAVSGPMGLGEVRTVSVADGHDPQGLLLAADVVPEQATAIAYNLTITATTGLGFLAIAPGDVTEVTSSAINWAADDVSIANAGVVKLDDQRQVNVTNANAGTTHFIIDITGFYQ